MARGVKRTASKTPSASSSAASTASKNKKKRGPIQLEVPSAPKKLGRVLTCGQGDVGQLGLGENVTETTKFKYVTSLGDNIVHACAGGMHTVALDKDGKVWTFGCNDEGALGREATDTEEGVPNTVKLPGRVVSISAGDSHTAALLDNGDVYAWGSFRDSHGSMGLVMSGKEGQGSRAPVRLDVGETSVAVASGGDHLVILTSLGSVFTLGCGEQGQLGRVSQRSADRNARSGLSALLVPGKVNIKGGATRIWAGYHATFALDANQEKMLAWGLNNYGQLGITGSNRKSAVFSPTECSVFAANSWKDVSPGQHHTLALDTNGVIYALGRCEYGRLGLGSSHTGDAESLLPIPKLQDKKCISISSGTGNSFCVTDTGESFAWGMGTEGQLGIGGSEDASEPKPIRLQDTDCVSHRVSAGGQHTVLYMVDPNAVPAPSPVPEPEVEPQTVEEEDEEEEEEEEKPKSKRSRKEVVKGSKAESKVGKGDVEEVNKAVKDDTPMDVDDTDAPQETKADDEKMTTDEATDHKKASEEVTPSETSKSDKEDKTEEPTQKDTEMSEKDNVDSQKDKEDSQKVGEDSQKDSVDSVEVSEDGKKVNEDGQKVNEDSQKVNKDSQKESIESQNDVEMKEDKPEIVNGNPELEIPEIKVSEDKKITSEPEKNLSEVTA